MDSLSLDNAGGGPGVWTACWLTVCLSMSELGVEGEENNQQSCGYLPRAGIRERNIQLKTRINQSYCLWYWLILVFNWMFLALIPALERLLAKGKAGIHTSCRSESSNYSLVVLDNQWQSLLGPLPTSPNCPLQPGIVENRRGLSTAISCWKHQFSSDHWS